jgi:hypothetical protein
VPRKDNERIKEEEKIPKRSGSHRVFVGQGDKIALARSRKKEQKVPVLHIAGCLSNTYETKDTRINSRHSIRRQPKEKVLS